MSRTVPIEVPAEHVAIVRQALAFAEELHRLALDAPEGTVFDACESAVITGGRQMQQQLLQDAVARRIETAEKKGRQSDSVPAVDRKKIADPKPDNSSAASG